MTQAIKHVVVPKLAATGRHKGRPIGELEALNVFSVQQLHLPTTSVFKSIKPTKNSPHPVPSSFLVIDHLTAIKLEAPDYSDLTPSLQCCRNNHLAPEHVDSIELTIGEASPEDYQAVIDRVVAHKRNEPNQFAWLASDTESVGILIEKMPWNKAPYHPRDHRLRHARCARGRV